MLSIAVIAFCPVGMPSCPMDVCLVGYAQTCSDVYPSLDTASFDFNNKRIRYRGNSSGLRIGEWNSEVVSSS